jgi:L-alanine-DL-glutamate epimerase-like enolase superfamily enzyme
MQTSIVLRTISLPLRHPFTITHETRDVQENVLVELRAGRRSGYGEAATSAYYGVTAATIRQALEEARSRIEAAVWDDPASLWQQLLPALGHNRSALAALDEAAHDLWGKRLGRPVHRLWGLDPQKIPTSDYTIGIDTVETMLLKMSEFPGWPVYKIKLGTPDDLGLVRRLRRHTAAVFRVDANCAWTAEQTIANSPELAALGVEFIEQPLPADDWEGMRRVFARSALGIIADESCRVEEDVDRCRECFHGINIKLVKCGGMTPARRMISRARELGLKVMLGCALESTVGISAAAQLLPLADYADLDSAALIAADVATGVRLDDGRAIFPEENGNGVRLNSA